MIPLGNVMQIGRVERISASDAMSLSCLMSWMHGMQKQLQSEDRRVCFVIGLHSVRRDSIAKSIIYKMAKVNTNSQH